jgi:energy-coupling factor transport system ATP-binding protein
MSEIIKTNEVYYEYRSHEEDAQPVQAVNGVSLAINQGEFVVILGRNGSGKSTLARLFNALLLPKEGTVYICGMVTHNEEHLWEIRKDLGLVLQNPDNQIVATTVEEDVAFGPENLGVPPQEIRQRVDSVLKLVGMESYAGHSPHMLSGGQKQRIAIAGILAMQPKCIVLDESTSMLDPSGRKEVMEVLHKLNRNNHITIVLITHHMDEAVEADRVMVMSHGKIVLKGRPREIFGNIEAVRMAGLDVPQVTALAHQMIKRGVPLKTLPIDQSEMIQTLKEVLANRSSRVPDIAPSYFEEQSSSEKAEAIITLKDVEHIYMPGTPYEQKALNKVSMTVYKGEILGVIGHTGSGKSTLVQHFNGLLKPSSGTILVDGQEASGKALKELRSKVGLIFQYPEHQLFEETVYKDITFGLNKLKLDQEEIKRRVFHVIDLLGISPDLLNKSPFELSGGQKRRVAIAGVLVMEPKVLVLDEPTAGLDPKGSRELFQVLSRLNRENGTTIVIISHNMEEIASLCHRVAVMRKGELVLCDTTRKVFSRSQELKSYSLDVPRVTALFEALSQEGIRLPAPVLTVREGAEILSKLIQGNTGGEGV